MKCKSDASAADLKGDLISYIFNSAIHKFGLQIEIKIARCSCLVPQKELGFS